MSRSTDDTRLQTRMCYNVYALHHAFGRCYQAAFGDTGFTYPKFIVLLALDESGPMSLGDLSSKVGLEANSISPMVKKMSNFGLIERVRDTEDERRVLLSLLPYGRTVLEEAHRVVNAGWSELGLSDEDVAEANALLARTRGLLEQKKPQLTMTIPERDVDD